MMRFGLKLGLATGAAYYIADQGVWKNSEEAVALCNKISKNVTPYTNEISKQIPYELPKLPETNEFSYLAKYYWNMGVKSSCRFLADLPSVITSWTNKSIDAVTESQGFKNTFSSFSEPEEKDSKPDKH